VEEPGTAMCKGGQRSDRLSVVRGKPKLLDQLREALRSRHYSRRTEH